MALRPHLESSAFLVLGWEATRTRPDGSFDLVARRFADQVAIALSQAEKREAQLEGARLHRLLEAGLLPHDPPAHPLADVVTTYLPGEKGMKLGADFLDVVDLDGTLAIVVGDVTGHGPRSAALGATLRATWLSLTLEGVSGVDLMSPLERVLLRERPSTDTLATLCAAWLDPSQGSLTFVLAGHPPPLWSSDGATYVELRGRPGLPLGTELDDYPPAVVSLELVPPWQVLFYTDGLVEGRDSSAGGRLGLAGLMSLLRRQAGTRPSAGVMEGLVAEVLKENGGPLRDDLAAVLVASRPAR